MVLGVQIKFILQQAVMGYVSRQENTVFKVYSIRLRTLKNERIVISTLPL